MFVVVTSQTAGPGLKVQVFGPFPTRELAQAVLDGRGWTRDQDDAWSEDSTDVAWVREVEAPLDVARGG